MKMPVLEALRYGEYLVHPKFFEVTDKAYLHLTQRGAAKNQAFIDYVEKSPRFLMPEEGFKRNNYHDCIF